MILNSFYQDINEICFNSQFRYMQIEQRLNAKLIMSQYEYALTESAGILNEGIFKAIWEGIKGILTAIRDFFKSLFGKCKETNIVEDTEETKEEIQKTIENIDDLQSNIDGNEKLEEGLKKQVELYYFNNLSPSGSNDINLFPEKTYSDLFLKDTDKVITRKKFPLDWSENGKVKSYGLVMQNISKICGYTKELTVTDFTPASTYLKNLKKECIVKKKKKFRTVNEFKNYMMDLKKMSEVLNEESFNRVVEDLKKNSDLVDKKIKDIERSGKDEAALKEYLFVLTECQREFNQGYALYVNFYNTILNCFKANLKVCKILINGKSDDEDKS